jgi:hypothetical protein
MPAASPKSSFLQCFPIAQKYVDQKEESEKRGLSKEEYDAIIAASEKVGLRVFQMLQKIDALLVDAAEQFDRYQQHEHGTIMLAYVLSGKRRGPFLFQVQARAEGGFRIFRMSKKLIAQWSVGRNWGPWHMNPGRPLKVALVAVSELLDFRVQVYAYLVGRPFMGLRAMENRWKSQFSRVARALDSMSHAIQHDWVRVRKERAAGIRPPRRERK